MRTLLVAGLGLMLLCPPVTAGEPNCLTPKETKQGYVLLFDGETLDGWIGATDGYEVVDGAIVCAKGGNLFTEGEYADFRLRLEFRLPENGNNGIGIRALPEGNVAHAGGMEIQVIDDTGEKYAGWLKPWQHCGSIYGLVPAKQGHLKPVGEWNSEEIVCRGSRVKITLNGTVIVDADLTAIDEPMDGKDHAGMHHKKGHIGFLGHGYPVAFRSIRVQEIRGDKGE